MARLSRQTLSEADHEKGVHPVVAAISPELKQLGQSVKSEAQANREHSEKLAGLSVHAMRLDVQASLPHAERAIQEAAQSSEAVISAAASALVGQSAAAAQEIAGAIGVAAQAGINAQLQAVQALTAAILRRARYTMQIHRDPSGQMSSVDVIPVD